MQLSPMIVDENNFYYRYLAFIKTTYPDKIKITDFEMKFQSSLSIDSYKILLSDLPSNSLTMNIEENSLLSAKSDGFNGDKIFSLLIDCSLPRRGNLLVNRAATVNVMYKLFGKPHNAGFFVNPMGKMSLEMPKKEATVFDFLKVLDNRILPKSFFTYHYSKINNESKDRSLEVYCSDSKNRLLKIKYISPSGTTILESGRPIHNDVDPIRILVLANNDILISSWLGIFRKEEIAAQFRLGMEHVKKEDYKAAAEVFKKITELDPKDYQAWFNYGLALEYMKDYEASIVAYQKAIEVKGDYSKAHYELGNVLLKTGNEVGGTDQLKLAIEINPNYALAYFRLGCLQKSQGNHEEAAHNISDAIKYESIPERRNKYKECPDDSQGFKLRESGSYPTEDSLD